MKRHQLIVRSRAERDLAAAMAEYAAITPGLGAAFLSRTNAAMGPSATGSGRSMFDSSFNRLTLQTAIALTPLGSPLTTSTARGEKRFALRAER